MWKGVMHRAGAWLRALRRDSRGEGDLMTSLLLTAAGAVMVGVTVPSLFESSDAAARTFQRQVGVLERGASGSGQGGIGGSGWDISIGSGGISISGGNGGIGGNINIGSSGRVSGSVGGGGISVSGGGGGSGGGGSAGGAGGFAVPGAGAPLSNGGSALSQGGGGNLGGGGAQGAPQGAVPSP